MTWRRINLTLRTENVRASQGSSDAAHPGKPGQMLTVRHARQALGNRIKFSFATEDTDYTDARFFEQVIFQMRCLNWAKTPLSGTEPPLRHYSAL